MCKNSQSFKVTIRVFLFGLAMSLFGCSSLLPTESKSTQSRWTSYEQAETEFSNIKIGETSIKQLKAMGIDPATTPNI